METLKKGDKVHVRPKYQTPIHHSTNTGRITGINPESRFPIQVQFNTHMALFQPYELEKI